MSVESMNPAGLVPPRGYSHLSIGRGARLIQVAGQVALDEKGEVVGPGDLAAQTARALENLVTALRAADACWADVASFTIYVVDWEESKLGALATGFGRAAEKLGLGRFEPKPNTLVGVAALLRPSLLVEIAATAVAD